MDITTHYELGRVLGTGSTGEVRLGRHRMSGENVAVKIISKKRLQCDYEGYRKVRREAAMMKLVHHPNILKLYDIFKTEENLYLILEHAANGELFDKLAEEAPLSETEALKIFQQIIQAVSYCHQRGIVHRDLKASNILLAEDGSIKLADFGMCSLVGPQSMLDTQCGTLTYLAPEVLAGDPYCGRKADIWSCGVLLYVLVTGSFPTDCENLRQQNLTIRSWGRHIPSSLVPSTVSAECRELIQMMLTIDSALRASLEAIMVSKWYSAVPLTGVARDDSFMTIDRPPILSPDEAIVRQLVDIGCGNMATIIRRLRSGRRCEEREFYFFLQEHPERVLTSKLAQQKAHRSSPDVFPHFCTAENMQLSGAHADLESSADTESVLAVPPTIPVQTTPV